MKKIIAIATVYAIALSPTPARADIWGWLYSILMPPNGFPTGTGNYIVSGWFDPETFGEQCANILAGCVTTSCGPVHFYPSIGPMTEVEAIRIYQVGLTTRPCQAHPVIQPPILGFN